eukprot:symbB.v1.2.010835.t2/scaffold683.1/size173061/8
MSPVSHVECSETPSVQSWPVTTSTFQNRLHSHMLWSVCWRSWCWLLFAATGCFLVHAQERVPRGAAADLLRAVAQAERFEAALLECRKSLQVCEASPEERDRGGEKASKTRSSLLAPGAIESPEWPENYGDLLRFPFGIADMKTLKEVARELWSPVGTAADLRDEVGCAKGERDSCGLAVTAGRPTATQGRVRTPIRCEVTIADQFLVEDMLHFGVVDAEVRAMALRKLKQSERTWLKFGAKIAGKAAGVCLAAAYSPYLVLGKLGFGASGIAAGSMAASSQGAAVAAGSWFAWAQSTAATGFGFWKLGAASAGTYTYIGGATQGKCERGEWTDKHLLMTLVDQGLVDYEMRNLMLSKLQMRSRLIGIPNVTFTFHDCILVSERGFRQFKGMRCTSEMVGVHPIGGVGTRWSAQLWDDAQDWCLQNTGCTGIMLYVGGNTMHCNFWCGRPQFCSESMQPSEKAGVEESEDWNLWVKEGSPEK